MARFARLSRSRSCVYSLTKVRRDEFNRMSGTSDWRWRFDNRVLHLFKSHPYYCWYKLCSSEEKERIVHPFLKSPPSRNEANEEIAPTVLEIRNHPSPSSSLVEISKLRLIYRGSGIDGSLCAHFRWRMYGEREGGSGQGRLDDSLHGLMGIRDGY